MIASERQLTNATVNGDHEAIADLLQQHDAALRQWLRGKIESKYQTILEVDDVLQVTYLEAFLRIRQFEDRGPGSFQAWLRRIAGNNLTDAMRQLNSEKRPKLEKRVSFLTSEHERDLLVAGLSGEGTTPSKGAARSENVALLEGALGKLPPDYETVIRLFDLQGIPTIDVASQMKRTAAAVYMLRARAHERLAEVLGEGTQFFSVHK
ncbi:MAG: RNA polymerase sigma factor [Phycisphaerae bacterium]